MQVDIFVLSRC